MLLKNFESSNFSTDFDVNDPIIPIIIQPFYGINQLHIAFSLIGTMIWVLGYAMFEFYKDYLITLYRKDEKFGRGFYYKYVQYQSYKKLIFGFNVLYLFFVFTLLLFHNMRYFCILSGMVIFFFGYFCICIKSYLIDQKKFDLFDEFEWFYRTFIKEKVSRMQSIKPDNYDQCSKAKKD